MVLEIMDPDQGISGHGCHGEASSRPVDEDVDSAGQLYPVAWDSLRATSFEGDRDEEFSLMEALLEFDPCVEKRQMRSRRLSSSIIAAKRRRTDILSWSGSWRWLTSKRGDNDDERRGSRCV